MKNIKKSFLMSSISLLLCFIMLLGTTFAWFTDSVTSSGNKIQAGTLKLDLEMLNKETGAYESIKTSKDPIFNYDLWEPGYTDVKFLKVENEGSLSLKWKAMFVSDEEVSKLAEVIDVYVLPSVTELGYDNLTRDFDGWRRVGTLDQFINTLSQTTYGNLLPYSCAYLGIALHMQEEAGNEYQEIGLEAFDIQIVATQMSNEEDSFGPDYDNDAEWPASGMNFSATQSLAGVSIINNELAEEVIIRHESGAYAIVPAGVKLAEGVTELKFSGKGLDNEAGNFAEDSKNYDIHIEGIADDNEKSITVFIGQILEAGLGETELKLYHEDAQMTRVDSVDDFATFDQFTYDAATGAVVLYVKNFSVFSGVKTSADVWDGTSDTSWYYEELDEFVLTTAEQFAGFRDLVDEGKTFEGKTVKLGADIDLNKIPFDPIGYNYESKGGQVFKGTFDGANHTIYNLYQNCWELDPDKTNYSTYTYSTAGAGLFASIKDATIKNLAVSGAEIVFECVDMGIIVGYAQGTCHFENIVVSHSKIANYNRYTGGVVGEVSGGPYGTNTKKGYSHTFKNIVVDSTVTVSGLWGSFGCGMGGVIGGKWGDATVFMENVISAPVMDVYNDVVSAYQWYAFRGCGMLIGHTEEPYSDGRDSGNATASFLTCENVNVYYGDWTNYTYYEFANQDSATGRSYPWVRAEDGLYCEAFSNIRYGVPTHNGKKVTEDPNMENLKTDYVEIKFNQLYGADRGMYGTANHPGVNVSYNLPKTFYIVNNLDWQNLKLYYEYKNGEDTWTNVVDGFTLVEFNGVYRIDVPTGVDSCIIKADEGKSVELNLSNIRQGEFLNLTGDHYHWFINKICLCGAVRFEFGENGSASHSDGNNNEISTYTEAVGAYTLSLTELSKIYESARDSKGNSCIKVGSSKSGGELSFTVPQNVNKVIILLAKYKNDDTKIIVNEEEYSIQNSSNDGKYDEIIIDTSIEKTVSISTIGGENRCMMNSIIFVPNGILDGHICNGNIIIPAKSATCTDNGLTEGTQCDICGAVTKEQTKIDKLGHTEVIDEAVPPKCNEAGKTQGSHCETCNAVITEQIEVPIDPNNHNYIDGVCIYCKVPEGKIEVTKTYVFSDYRAGTQYAENEEHQLDENVTIITTQSHFTSELRLYSSSTHNGYAIVQSTNPITQVDINAGYKADELVIYGSNDDGTTWTEVATISITSTSYNDYTVELNGSYNWIKLDVKGENQVRIKTLTLTTVSGGNSSETPDCTHENTTENTVDATCGEAGTKTVVCDDCGETISTETIEATGEHTYKDGVCAGCGKEEETTGVETTTISFASTEQRLSQTNSQQVWKNGDVTFTNDKASSTSNVADYSNPVRLYKSSKVTIEAAEITKIVFDCNSSSYATSLKKSIGDVGGATVTVNSDKVTVEFSAPVNSFVIKSLSDGQVRLDSITVTYVTTAK